jgi:hypothetical protein
MALSPVIDESVSSRDLVRALRVGASRLEEDVMPESVAWRSYHELCRRGYPDAGELFLGALRTLHSRRSMAGSSLSTSDPHSNEHRLTEDALLAELWKAYKRCIRNNRTGPAQQLLREIEDRLAA